jgi:hypothetical protein
MPSIFIWKSTTPNTSHKQIKYYTGSNWFLEDNETYSKSYMYLEQMVITGFDDSVITFNVKQMPQDWVGSELLEVTSIPYCLVKSDTYGTLEMVGEWMRFTSKRDIIFNNESLQTEVLKIKKWIDDKHAFQEKSSHTAYPLKLSEKPKQYKDTNSRNMLIDNISNNNKNNKSFLDTNKIQNDFQQFLSQYNLHNIQSVVNTKYIKT